MSEKKVYILTDGSPNAEILAVQCMDSGELKDAQDRAQDATDGNLSWFEYRGPVIPRDEDTDAILLTVAKSQDKQGRFWYALERGDGSISVYYTHPDTRGGVYVVWDTSHPSTPDTAPAQPAPGGVIFSVADAHVTSGPNHLYFCETPGDHSGEYYPASQVAALVAALKEIDGTLTGSLPVTAEVKGIAIDALAQFEAAAPLPTWRIDFYCQSNGQIDNALIRAATADEALRILHEDAEQKWCPSQIIGQPRKIIGGQQ